MRNKILASETFSRHGRHYHFDFKLAQNNCNYINVTRSDLQTDGTYSRTTIPIWQEDFDNFIWGFSSLMQSAAYLDQQDETVQDMYKANRQMREKGIKSWVPEQRPREKMMEWGADSMSNAELLAMVIGSGTVDETAVDLAERIIDAAGGKLYGLLTFGYRDLCRFAGMGIAKSSSIIAAMEIARRTYVPRSLPRIVRSLPLGGNNI